MLRILCVLLFSMTAFAATVRDSESQFVYADTVFEFSKESCLSGTRVLPERMTYRENNAMPYRVFRIALPSAEKPKVKWRDISTVTLEKYCSEDTLIFTSVIVETPFLKDGVFMTDVWVPLLKGNASNPVLRKQFELEISYVGKPRGIRPGKRALGAVMNPKAALRFGQMASNAALRKSVSNAEENISSAEWLVRFAVGDKEHAGHSENGLYGVSFKEIRLALASVSRTGELDGVLIENLRLYGASPDTLPDVIRGKSDMLPNHLYQLPIRVADKNKNGIFDEGDSLYFVGYGTSIWKRVDQEDKTYASDPMAYYFSSSPYSFYQYFQLAVQSSGTQKKLTEYLNTKSFASSTKSIPLWRYVRAEKDMLLRDTYFGRETGTWDSESGKEWFWAWNLPETTTSLSARELAFSTTASLPGFIANQPNYFSVTFFPRRSTGVADLGDGLSQMVDSDISGQSYAKRMEPIRFEASVNGVVPDFSLSVAGNYTATISNLKSSGNEYSLQIKPNGRMFDRFDGYSIAYAWTPQTDSADWVLPGYVSGKIKFKVPSSLAVMKWSQGKEIGLVAASDGIVADSILASEDARYLIYNPKRILNLTVEAIPPKLSGVLARPEKISSKTEYLIIAPEEFQEPALQLAEFRAGDGAAFPLVTSLVLAEDLYKLYTGGSLSPIAIRNYLAYARSVCPNLQYVLLAGAAHYDYRGKSGSSNPIRIPTFEKEDAVIEDFFAVLDSGESVRFGTYDLDLVVGRLPLQSVADFYAYNEKVQAYERKGKMQNGSWRNTIVFAADDAKNGVKVDMQPHTAMMENLASSLDSVAYSEKYRLYQQKIYLLDYEEDALGQKPEAASDLLNAFDRGALFTLYFGHGSITDWASEGLLKSSYISRLSNEGYYTILASFSCSLGRFDKLNERSLSEQFVNASGKGSIASIGATRESYGSKNEIFAKNFLMSAVRDSAVRLGTAFFNGKGRAKQSYSALRYNNERYALLGEPVLSMPVPKYKVRFDQKMDSLQALDKVKLSGTVHGIANGKIYLSVREGSKQKKLSQAPAYETDSVQVTYDGSLIYSETLPVRNGKFSTEFITPGKIAFGDTAAEISAYAYSESEPYIGRYVQSKILISGTSTYADSIHDETPPEIKISTCSSVKETYLAEGQKILLESPACLQVDVEDSTALDFSEEADEGVSFEVDGVTSPFHPWPYLEQTAKKLSVRMAFAENSYAPGTYVFKVRAQDILGNVAKKSVTVEITESLKSGLADVFNAPNPMGKKGTVFYFKDLAVGRSAKVSISIYNQNGRLVQRIKNVKSGVTHWDGRDFYGRYLANGLYHYIVKSEVPATDTSKKKTFIKKQKLLISR